MISEKIEKLNEIRNTNLNINASWYVDMFNNVAMSGVDLLIGNNVLSSNYLSLTTSQNILSYPIDVMIYYQHDKRTILIMSNSK